MLSFTGDYHYDELFSCHRREAASSWNLTINTIYQTIAKANLSSTRILEELLSQLRLIQEDAGEVKLGKEIFQNVEKDVLASPVPAIGSIAEEVEEIIQLIKKANYTSLYKPSQLPKLRDQILASLLALKTRKQPQSISEVTYIVDYLALISLFKSYFHNTVPSNIRNELLLQAEVILNQLYQHQVTQSDTRLRAQVLATLSMVSELCDFIKNQTHAWRTQDFFTCIKKLPHELDLIFTLLSRVKYASINLGAN